MLEFQQKTSVSSEMPSLGFYLPDDSPLTDKIKARAVSRHDGKVSAYIRSLVEKDLGKAMVSPMPIAELVDRFAPSRTGEAMSWIAKANEVSGGTLNQSRVIASLLESLIELAPTRATDYRYIVSSPMAPPAILMGAEDAAPYGVPVQKRQSPKPGHGQPSRQA
jgi:hypothetical protein